MFRSGGVSSSPASSREYAEQVGPSDKRRRLEAARHLPADHVAYTGSPSTPGRPDAANSQTLHRAFAAQEPAAASEHARSDVERIALAVARAVDGAPPAAIAALLNVHPARVHAQIDLQKRLSAAKGLFERCDSGDLAIFTQQPRGDVRAALRAMNRRSSAATAPTVAPQYPPSLVRLAPSPQSSEAARMQISDHAAREVPDHAAPSISPASSRRSPSAFHDWGQTAAPRPTARCSREPLPEPAPPRTEQLRIVLPFEEPPTAAAAFVPSRHPATWVERPSASVSHVPTIRQERKDNKHLVLEALKGLGGGERRDDGKTLAQLTGISRHAVDNVLRSYNLSEREARQQYIDGLRQPPSDAALTASDKLRIAAHVADHPDDSGQKVAAALNLHYKKVRYFLGHSGRGSFDGRKAFAEEVRRARQS